VYGDRNARGIFIDRKGKISVLILATYWRIIKRSDLFNHEHEQALARERAKYMRNTREKRKVFMVLPRDSVP